MERPSESEAEYLDPTIASPTPERPDEDPADPVAELEGEVAKWKELALRTAADFENYRKRMTRERAEALQYANSSLLESLLPVLDNYEMGLKAAQASPTGDASSILLGMGMVLKQFQDLLKDYGVEPVPGEGAPFDPNQHEAVQQEASDTVPEGTVIRLLRPGYKLRERLLRAAVVAVSTGPAKDRA
ncbi:MAG: nucleotide exchange factor GrpE [Verrucomicrobiales bacterium]|nr:nucleotide exchange factor GrpE [Verrucomicrobiales bacterium]